MEIVRRSELVHLIERRMFVGDVRRHFVGEVTATSDVAVRLEGYLFVYDTGRGRFVRKDELRTRIVALDNRVILNVLPRQLRVDELEISTDAEGNLSLADGKGFDIDISEFSVRE